MSRLLPAFLFLTTPLLAADGNWPMWRGPRGDGTTDEKGFPTKWSATDNVVWKTPIPGKGHSSPIVWGDRVFVTSAIEDGDPNQPKDRLLLCLDRKDGRVLWQKAVARAKAEPIHKLNSRASSTPATDGERVFVTFLDNPNVVVAAYDFAGNEVWKVSPGEFESRHGFCSPPVLYRNLVIVNCDQDGFDKKKPAYVVALDRKTGSEKWRIDRSHRIRSYCPPLITEAAGRMQMVLTGAETVASYDPDTGKPLWTIDGPTEQFVASMVYSKGLFFLTAGFPTYHVMGIKPDGSGNVTKTHVAWHEKNGGAGYVPSPVAHGDNIFLVHDEGRATCRDALNGKLHWMERLGKHHSASPICAEGRLYFPDDDGVTWVVKAGEKFELLEKNSIGENCYASPAFSKGQIYLRGARALFCVGEKN
ncbi:MAG TPA: PQQ-binding-like beta-propeller repeat protein [Gemmataceae bacterium]|nr:PQQ-binding-like beta-propeller repeat protein [Gemmataceae bacterium]